MNVQLKDVSKFLTTTTLDEIIERAGGTRHTSYQFLDGFAKGDSYLSKVYRLRVTGINEAFDTVVTVNMIVKGMPENEHRRRVFRSPDFFRNEVNFYTKVLPAFEEFQEQRKPKHPFTEYPICYASHCDGENDFVALEDVTYTGYGAPKRQDTISLQDCLLTMRSLGRFHGMSLAMKTLEPEEFQKLATNAVEETYYSERLREWYAEFLQQACAVAKDAVSQTYPNSKYEEITNNFLQDKLYSELINLVSTQTKLSVITHGDCWVPNFLTKYDYSGNPEAIKIIDFQLARYGSLALDLSFFIYSCTSQTLREQYYEYILKEYHDAACAIISDMGADPNKVLTWSALLEEMQQFARFGCGMGIESLPLSMLEEHELFDMDEILFLTYLAEVWNIQPLKDPAKRERIAQMFKHAIDKGYIQ